MAQISVPESIGRLLYTQYFHKDKDFISINRTDKDFEKKVKGFTSRFPHNRFVVKPDYTIGKRGKNNLVGLNLSAPDIHKFLLERDGISYMGKSINRYLITPYIPHDSEYYVSISTLPLADEIIFSSAGGVDIEENWDRVYKIRIPVLEKPQAKDMHSLFKEVTDKKTKDVLSAYILTLLQFFRETGCCFLELNPFVIEKDQCILLDCKMRLDDCNFFTLQDKLDIYSLLAEVTEDASPEEAYIKEIDRLSGASLKMHIINRNGRIWPMIAGGGASIIYFDSFVSMGFGEEIAFYGEYSGNPSTELTYAYSKTIIDLMLKSTSMNKVLIIGGGNANFTDIAKTFTGIKQAIIERIEEIKKQHISILVRRGGPNSKAGLKIFSDMKQEYDIDIHLEATENSLVHILRYIPKKSTVDYIHHKIKAHVQ